LEKAELTTNEAYLFEGSRYATERRVQFGAEVLDDGDNGKGNARSDDSVFGSRCARLVIHKPQEHILHPLAPAVN
jgi:hypothetical protein